MWPCAVVSPEQREVEQEEGSEGQEEGQDSPIACGDDIHLYDNQISPGPGQYRERDGVKSEGERQVESERAAGVRVCGGDKEGGGDGGRRSQGDRRGGGTALEKW